MGLLGYDILGINVYGTWLIGFSVGSLSHKVIWINCSDYRFLR